MTPNDHACSNARVARPAPLMPRGKPRKLRISELSEELRGGRRRHRGGRHHHRHLASGGPQLPQAAERRPGRGITDDQVILAVPAAQFAIEQAAALRIIIDHHQHRTCHRLVLTHRSIGHLIAAGCDA